MAEALPRNRNNRQTIDPFSPPIDHRQAALRTRRSADKELAKAERALIEELRAKPLLEVMKILGIPSSFKDRKLLLEELKKTRQPDLFDDANVFLFEDYTGRYRENQMLKEELIFNRDNFNEEGKYNGGKWYVPKWHKKRLERWVAKAKEIENHA